MQISLREFLLTTISTLLESWFGDINRVCAACYANSREPISPWPMISRRRLFCGLTRTSAVFVEKRVFQPGFIGSHIIAFERTRGGAKILSASMRSNFKPSRILRLSIPV